MRLQTTVIATATLILSICGAQSQNHPGKATGAKRLTSEQMIERRVGVINKVLTLTEQQLTEIRAIVTNSSSLLQKARSTQDTKVIKDINTQTDNAISKVLTPSQNEQYAKFLEQRRLKHTSAASTSNHTAPAEKHIAKLRSELDLTEAQAKQIEQVIVKGNSEVHKLKAQTRSQIQALLTDAQKAKYAELHKTHKKSMHTPKK